MYRWMYLVNHFWKIHKWYFIFLIGLIFRWQFKHSFRVVSNSTFLSRAFPEKNPMFFQCKFAGTGRHRSPLSPSLLFLLPRLGLICLLQFRREQHKQESVSLCKSYRRRLDFGVSTFYSSAVAKIRQEENGFRRKALKLYSCPDEILGKHRGRKKTIFVSCDLFVCVGKFTGNVGCLLMEENTDFRAVRPTH